jgi:uncharacterized protein
VNPDEIRKAGEGKYPHNAGLVKKLKKKPPANLDTEIAGLEEEEFAVFSCLSCANCCKTTSPIFYETDITRLSRALRMKPGEVVEKFLKIDGDGDYVLKGSPCVFLAEDNSCVVYEARPAACREYPHLNRKKMYQVLDLALKNSLICPVVQKVFDKLRKIY